MAPIRELLVVGGGTAGWLTAAFLARTLGAQAPEGLRVTLVESDEIPAIGVGEGTFPSIRGTLAAIGLDEATFLREAQATYKQGIRFDDWLHGPAPGTVPAEPAARRPVHSYLHPFSTPSQRPGAPELLPWWLAGAADEAWGGPVPFTQAATLQHRLVAEGRAPKRATDPDWQGPLNHAFHLDAGRFAQLLARHAQSLGVRRIVDTVEQVEVDSRGHIAGVVTRAHGTLVAGLYVDCTGLRARLVGQALGSALRPVGDTLFVDRALAMQVPHASPDAPLPSVTISTAHPAGWTWDIALQARRGVGHVYSSRHTSDDEAERVLRAHVGPAGLDLPVRLLPLQLGWRERSWVGNCVAIGLSGGFLEPLESSGIGLVEAGAYLLGYLFPWDGAMEAASAHFNRQMHQRYERIVDFIKLHYALSRRPEPFWRDNADRASWPDSLKHLLERWAARPPHRLDFVTDLEMYPPSSWQYVLHGLGQRPASTAAARAAMTGGEAARREFAMLRAMGERACADLPLNRELLRRRLG